MCYHDNYYLQLVMHQLFSGLEYIHVSGVCHRDVQPQNLLLNPDTGVLKIYNFARYVPYQ